MKSAERKGERSFVKEAGEAKEQRTEKAGQLSSSSRRGGQRKGKGDSAGQLGATRCLKSPGAVQTDRLPSLLPKFSPLCLGLVHSSAEGDDQDWGAYLLLLIGVPPSVL